MSAPALIVNVADDEYIRAASDTQLSLPETRLLATLLAEEDQHDYNQLLQLQLVDDVHHILQQLCLLLQVSPSAQWMATILVKKVILLHQEQHSLDLLTLVACVTLACKYQDSSPQPINYELIADCCQIDNIEELHDAELRLLDLLSWDICATTPDHFFSYLSNVAGDDNKLRQAIEESRSYQTYRLLHNYPCSIVALSLMYNNNASKTFITDQIETFLRHKKDPGTYFMQLLNCTTQLQSAGVGASSR